MSKICELCGGDFVPINHKNFILPSIYCHRCVEVVLWKHYLPMEERAWIRYSEIMNARIIYYGKEKYPECNQLKSIEYLIEKYPSVLKLHCEICSKLTGHIFQQYCRHCTRISKSVKNRGELIETRFANLKKSKNIPNWKKENNKNMLLYINIHNEDV